MSAAASILIDLADRVSAKLRRIGERFLDMDRALASFRGAQDYAAKLSLVADSADKVGRGLRDGMAAPIKVAADLEDVLTRVGAKSSASAEELASLKASAREFGKDSRFRFSASQVAEGFDVLATSGAKPAEALDLIESKLVLAAAGFTDVATATQLSGDVMGAWSLPATRAMEVTDLLAGAANTSKQSIGTLSESLKAVAPVAAKAGASIGDVLAIQAALASEGVRGGEAGTVSRALFLRLQAPEKIAAAKLRALKVATKDASGNLRAIDDVMRDLSVAMDAKFGKGQGGNKRARFMKELFGEEGVAGAQIVMKAAVSGTLDEFKRGIEGFDAAAAAAAANSNTAGAVATLKSSMEELSLVVGDTLLPSVNDALKRTTSLAGRLGQLAAENPATTKSLVGVGVATAGIATGTAVTLRVVSLFRQGAAALRVALVAVKVAAIAASGAFRAMAASLLANPIAIAVAAVVGLVVAGVALYRNWDKVSAFFRGVWERLPGPVQSALRLITAPIRIIIRAAGALWEGTKAMAARFGEAWSGLSTPVKVAVAVITGPIGWLIGAATLISENWDSIGGVFSSIWEGIKATIADGVQWIADKLTWMGDQIEGFERNLPEWITGREAVIGGGAAAAGRAALAAGQAQASGAPIGGQAEALAAARAMFGGELRIVIDDPSGAVAATSSRTTGGSGIRLATGVQT